MGFARRAVARDSDYRRSAFRIHNSPFRVIARSRGLRRSPRKFYLLSRCGLCARSARRQREFCSTWNIGAFAPNPRRPFSALPRKHRCHLVALYPRHARRLAVDGQFTTTDALGQASSLSTSFPRPVRDG